MHVKFFTFILVIIFFIVRLWHPMVTHSSFFGCTSEIFELHTCKSWNTCRHPLYLSCIKHSCLLMFCFVQRLVYIVFLIYFMSFLVYGFDFVPCPLSKIKENLEDKAFKFLCECMKTDSGIDWDGGHQLKFCLGHQIGQGRHWTQMTLYRTTLIHMLLLPLNLFMFMVPKLNF